MYTQKDIHTHIHTHTHKCVAFIPTYDLWPIQHRALILLLVWCMHMYITVIRQSSKKRIGEEYSLPFCCGDCESTCLEGIAKAVCSRLASSAKDSHCLEFFVGFKCSPNKSLGSSPVQAKWNIISYSAYIQILPKSCNKNQIILSNNFTKVSKFTKTTI